MPVLVGEVSAPSGWVVLVAVATVVDGLLAGASLDQSIKQLPARHRIGMRAFSAYSRASDQAHGLLWYTTLGLGGAALTVATAIWALAFPFPRVTVLPVLLAGALAVATRSPRPGRHRSTGASGRPRMTRERWPGSSSASSGGKPSGW